MSFDSDLHIWDVRPIGSATPCTVVSQDPAEAPETCPECKKPMETICIGCNGVAHFYIKVCPCTPNRVWNASRYD